MRERSHWVVSESHWGQRTVCTNHLPLPRGSFALSVPESDLAVSLSLEGGWLFLLLFDPLVGAFAMDVPVFAALGADASAVAHAWACGAGVLGLPPLLPALRFSGPRPL